MYRVCKQKKDLIICFNKHTLWSFFPSELRQRHVTPRPPVPVTPNLAVAARPPPGPTAPPALISAPGGPPERNLSTSGQHHNLLRRSATPTGSPAAGVGE